MILLQMAPALSPASTLGGSQLLMAPVQEVWRLLMAYIGICTQGSMYTQRHMNKNKFLLNTFPWAWDIISLVVEHFSSTHRPWVLCQAPHQTNPQAPHVNSLTRLHLSCHDYPHFQPWWSDLDSSNKNSSKCDSGISPQTLESTRQTAC